MATLSTFCKAVYLKQQPLGSQPTFITALFGSAGASFAYGDDHGRSLANGSQDLTQDIRDTFPDVFNGAEVSAFLHKYLTDTTVKSSDLNSRCTDVAANAGLSTDLIIEPDAAALADWFQAIIKTPENSDILPPPPGADSRVKAIQILNRSVRYTQTTK